MVLKTVKSHNKLILDLVFDTVESLVFNDLELLEV